MTEAERTSSGIALEDLGGIRQRVRLRKPQRVTLHSWAFHQLGQFVEYKARRAGVPLVYVDPAYTEPGMHQVPPTSRRRTGSTRPSSFAEVRGRCPRRPERFHNIAARGEAVWIAGHEGARPQHLSRCLDGGGHTTASGALPPSPLVNSRVKLTAAPTCAWSSANSGPSSGQMMSGVGCSTDLGVPDQVGEPAGPRGSCLPALVRPRNTGRPPAAARGGEQRVVA